MRGRKRTLILVFGLILSLMAIGVAAAQDTGESEEMPFLGVRLLESDDGVTIAEVVADSPAAEAELEVGDLITAVNGEEVDSAQAVTDAIRALSPGDTVTLDITRDEETLTVEATLGTAPTVTIEVSPDRDDDRGGRGGRRGGMGDPRGGMRGMMIPRMQFMFGNGWLGVSFVTLDAETAAENEVELTEGALILSVEEESPAAEAGLQEGDVVTAVNGEPVDAERTLRDRLIAYEPDDTVTLTITRDGESQDIDVTLAQPNFERGGFGLMPFDLDQLREMFSELDIEIPGLDPEATPGIKLTPESSASV